MICQPHAVPGVFAKFLENTVYHSPLHFYHNYGFCFLEEGLRGQVRKQALSSLPSYVHHPSDCNDDNDPVSYVIYPQSLSYHLYLPEAENLTHLPRSQPFLKSLWSLYVILANHSFTFILFPEWLPHGPPLALPVQYNFLYSPAPKEGCSSGSSASYFRAYFAVCLQNYRNTVADVV